MLAWRIVLLFLIAAQPSAAAPACETIGNLNDDLLLGGRKAINKDTCVKAKNLTFASDAVLDTNGFALSIEVAGDLVSKKGATVRAFDYDKLTFESSLPPPPLDDRPLSYPSYDPGPDTEGNPNGTGRNGGVFSDITIPNFGRHGKDGIVPRDIELRVSGSATGELLIVAKGTDGQRGGDGGAGWPGGDGEQGRRAQTGFPCAAGGAHGGKGGFSYAGDIGGPGGSGGNGGTLVVEIGKASPQFKLGYEVSGGRPGAPGQPGLGGLAGLQGCGGRGATGCFSEVIARQGVLGHTAGGGRMGPAGSAGIAGVARLAGMFSSVDQGAISSVCDNPPALDEVTKDYIDRLMYFTFWAVAGKDLIGRQHRYVRTTNGRHALVIQQVSNSTNPLGFLSSTKLTALVQNPPPRPVPVPSGCTGLGCCATSIWSGCLEHEYWRLRDNPDGKARYRDRLIWRDKLIELLHIEAAKSALFINSNQPEEQVLESDAAYVELASMPNTKLFLKLDEALFTRLVLTINRLHRDIRVALDARAPIPRRFDPGEINPLPQIISHTNMYCTFGNIRRNVGYTYLFYPTHGVADTEPGFDNLLVVSDKAGVELHEPNPIRQFLVLAIGNLRSETIFNDLMVAPASDAGKWPQRPGFTTGGFCKFYSKPRPWRERPLTCSVNTQRMVDAIVPNWRSLDVPSVITVVHLLMYLDTLLVSENLQLGAVGGGGELALHCFSNP